MSALKKASILATGFSMFSMFFGAGNVVFPLVLGQAAGNNVSYAAIGLIITGILLPFVGLLSMMVFRGDYKSYFMRLGKWPGLFLIFLIMAIMGPFAGIPRTITLSQATMDLSGANIPAWIFNGLFCLLFFSMAYKRTIIVDILGYILTPLLILLLSIITIAGLLQPTYLPLSVTDASWQTFLRGMLEGYNTLDLLAALFFSTVIITALQARFLGEEATTQQRHIFQHASWASVIGGVLLGLVYVGFCLLAAKYSANLQGLAADELIAYLSYQILGDHGGWVVNGVVSLACLTTAVALASVFAQVMCQEFTGAERYYPSFLLGTTLIAYAMSFVGFSGLIQLIYPLLVICYPCIIVLAIMNIGHKLWGWNSVKIPVFLTATISLIWFFV